ncbi:MAG: hypothetical protein K0Q53_287 [Massilibacillus sp.]|nr:hypothetical protein [Massilibacillus sp.]
MQELKKQAPIDAKQRNILINIKDNSNISLGITRQQAEQRLKELDKEYLIDQMP